MNRKVGQADQGFRVMVLAIGGFHQIAAEKIIDGGEPAGIRVPPGGGLHGGEAEGADLDGDGVHAELRENQRVESMSRDGLAPLLEPHEDILGRQPNIVSEQEVERLRATVKSRQGALDAANAQLEVVQARIENSLPAKRASAEAALAQAEVEIEKATVFAGTDGTVKQFVLKVGDIVNPILRPAGILIPANSGRGAFQAGFRQISAQVLHVGMLMEITCPSKPLNVIPMVVTEIQDAIAGGQLRPTDQLIELEERARPGTVVTILEPIFENAQSEAIPPGSVCVGVAYSSHESQIESGEVSGFTAFALRLVDGMGIANAIVIRGQALLLPIRAIVFPG